MYSQSDSAQPKTVRCLCPAPAPYFARKGFQSMCAQTNELMLFRRTEVSTAIPGGGSAKRGSKHQEQTMSSLINSNFQQIKHATGHQKNENKHVIMLISIRRISQRTASKTHRDEGFSKHTLPSSAEIPFCAKCLKRLGCWAAMPRSSHAPHCTVMARDDSRPDADWCKDQEGLCQIKGIFPNASYLHTRRV